MDGLPTFVTWVYEAERYVVETECNRNSPGGGLLGRKNGQGGYCEKSRRSVVIHVVRGGWNSRVRALPRVNPCKECFHQADHHAGGAVGVTPRDGVVNMWMQEGNEGDIGGVGCEGQNSSS